MSSSFYEFDDRSLTGYAHIDAAHREIAQISTKLDDMLRAKAPFVEVRETVGALFEALFHHFDVEEKLIAALGKEPEVVDHLRRHKESHDVFRLTAKYLDAKFREKEASGEVPNIVEAIPAKYFEELKGADEEMAALFGKRAPV